MDKIINHHVSQDACTKSLSSVGDAIYAIGGKWKLKIIIALTHGNKRFNELQRAVTGISARVLSTELKELEMNGFINRKVYPDTPVMVEYLLTEYSDTLQPIMLALSEWGSRHRDKIMSEAKIATASRQPSKINSI